MNSSSSSEVTVRPLPHGVRYELPPRNLGSLATVGKAIFAVGLVVALGTAVASASTFLKNSEQSTGFRLFDLVFSFPFWFGSVMAIVFGAFVAWGRSIIELADGEIVAIEKAGWLSWKRKRPLSRIRRFDVTTGATKVNNQPVTSGPLADLATITVECDSAKPMLLAMGYPRQLLESLANDLARRTSEANLLTGNNAAPEVRVSDAAAIEEQDDLLQPQGSKVTLEESPSATILTVPAAGLWRGSKGLFFFALLWLAFSSAMLVAMVLAEGSKGEPVPVAGWLFLSLFEAIGIAMLLAAVNMGKRQAMFAVTGTELKCAEVNLFGTKKHTWPIQSVTNIATGPSGMKVNKRHVMQLQITSDAGMKGMLAGRDEAELRWMAAVLRRALRSRKQPV